MSALDKPCRKPDYRLERIDNELLLFHPAQAKIMHCNETASLIWQLCDGRRTSQEITALLAEAFPEAAHSMAADVEATLKQFSQHGAIEFIDQFPVGDTAGTPETRTSSPNQNAIDVVYTWVDGADPGFQAQLQEALRAQDRPISPEAISSQRFRDNGELRYSLRSLEAFAPWVRSIHIVTSGQLPEWLDKSNQRLSIVTHDMIFRDKSYLPTFNSCAIELQLHRIPHLSERFLYLNDDMYLGRAISKIDFFTARGGQYVYFEPIRISSDLDNGPVHDRAYAHTQAIVEKLWGRNRARFLPAHTPQLYDRRILGRLEQLLPHEFRETSSHKFRAPNDLVLRILYSFYLLESQEQAQNGHQAKLLQWGSSDYDFAMLASPIQKARLPLQRIRHNQPKFFCTNDDLSEASADHIILRSLRLFLRSYYPRPGPLERNL